MPPLEAIHVLDLSLLLPGPLCTQILYDLGATVTKIEPPGAGDYMALWPPQVGTQSAMYLAVNHGKQIRTLNLKTDDDRATFFDLVRRADVVVEGFRPGVIDKLGIGYEQLSAANPGIILCSISGYGQSGPLRDRAGHDLNYQALAGVLSLSGGATPANPQLQAADTAGGSYAAAMLILAALYERTRTGRGRHIDVAMSEQLLPLVRVNFACSAADQSDPRRDGELLSGGAPCYHIYITADNKQLSVGALEPKFWDALLVAVEAPDLAEYRHLVTGDAPHVQTRLETIFRQKTLAEWVEVFAATDACCEPVLSLSEVKTSAHWTARHSFQTIHADDGTTLTVPKLPGSLAGLGRAPRPAE